MSTPLPSPAYLRWFKRPFDACASLLGLIFVTPVLAVTALLVRASLGTPVLFRQERPGLGGRPFSLVKFRTMREAFDSGGVARPDEERLTPFGRALRSWSLDELPTLWNVLVGDMSLVGPRPLLMEYLPRYTPEQIRRHEVRPGITGWAQVNGRNALTWEEKFRLDVWYVDHLSFAMDFKILLMTAWKVVHRQGITANNHATMPEFLGSPNGGGDVRSE